MTKQAVVARIVTMDQEEQVFVDFQPVVNSSYTIEDLRLRAFTSRLSIIREIKDQEDGFQSFLASYPSEGLEVYTRINIPMSDMPKNGYPVIVFAHGYSPEPADPIYFQRPYYETWINAYAEAGFLVIMPGYRGHGIIGGVTSEGGVFIDEYSEKYMTTPFYTVDVLNLIASLPSMEEIDWKSVGFDMTQHPLIDSNNLFLSAHSMGGDIALSVLSVNDQFKAASIWAGVAATVKEIVAFYTKYRLAESKSDRSFDDVFKDKWVDIQQAAKAPPLNLPKVDAANGYMHLKDIQVPLILHHGTQDTAVPAAWSVRLDDALKVLGKESVLFLYEGNDHELSLDNAHETAIMRDLALFKGLI